MAATPSHPAARAVLAGSVMSVMLGVILAHTGRLALALIQPHTSCMHRRMHGPREQPACMLRQGGHGVNVVITHEEWGSSRCCSDVDGRAFHWGSTLS